MKNHLQLFLCAVAVATCVTLCACSDDPDAPQEKASSVPLTSAQREIATKSADFTNNLFNATSQLYGDKNFIISPLGASMTLSMIANGAEGNTQKEILGAMGIAENDIECLNSLNKQLLENLAPCSLCDIRTGNSFWYNNQQQPALILKPEFKEVLTDSYNADIFGVSKDEFIQAANNWIARQVAVAPSGFLNPEDADDFGMSFFSTLDFNAKWDKTGGLTPTKLNFHNANDTSREIDALLHEQCEIAWSTGFCYIVDLPYKGYQCFLRIIYPYEGVSVDECLSQYKEWLADPKNKYYYRFGLDMLSFNTYFPKLDFTSDVNLIPMLKQMGIEDLFDKDKCRLSGIALDGNGLITVLKQQTKIKVDEKGTVAQSVTQGSGPLGSAVPHPIPKDLKIERPFAFEIYESSTGVSLLQGRINNL